jgi:hypothetical protein
MGFKPLTDSSFSSLQVGASLLCDITCHVDMTGVGVISFTYNGFNTGSGLAFLMVPDNFTIGANLD